MIKIQRIILTSPPIAFTIRKSKKFTLPGFQGLSLYDVVHFFINQINRVGLNERASAISFNTLLALPPACIFLFTLLPYVPASDLIHKEILGILSEFAPTPSASEMIQSFINDFFQPRTGLLSFGFLLAIFYASNAMMGMINTFDKSIREHKGFFLQKRLKAIQLTFILTLLVIVSGFVLVAQEAVIKWLLGLQSSKSISWWPYVRWTMLILIIFLSIALIYRFGPSVKKKWKLASPGALLSTSLILLTTLAFSYWVNNFGTYNTLYGSVGTILVLMLIIYFNAMIILIGFELNVSITYLLAESEKRKLKSMDGLDN